MGDEEHQVFAGLQQVRQLNRSRLLIAMQGLYKGFINVEIDVILGCARVILKHRQKVAGSTSNAVGWSRAGSIILPSNHIALGDDKNIAFIVNCDFAVLKMLVGHTVDVDAVEKNTAGPGWGSECK